MQKALLLALTIGAFLFSLSVESQTFNPPVQCESGETWLPIVNGCGIVAPEQSCEIFKIRPSYPFGTTQFDTLDSYHSAVAAKSSISPNPTCNGLSTGGSRTSTVQTIWSSNLEFQCPSPIEAGQIKANIQPVVYSKEHINKTATKDSSSSCSISDAPTTNTSESLSVAVDYRMSDDIVCSSEYPDGLHRPAPPDDLNLYCYRIPEQLPDEEEEPPCDDITGNCDPLPPEPDCFLTGAGSEVCFADPNDKCDKEIVNEEPVFSNCAAGCGFVNDNFLCADKPDLPSLDDCLVTTNGYACPTDIPEPNDDIDNPEKPLPDMAKVDFKDVLKGVETRQDGTNKLLADQIARDKDNTNKLAGLLATGNKSLKSIEDNTGSTAKSLKDALFGDALEIPDDDASSILSRLGITGDESMDDLELGVVNLGDYRDQFNWSAGSSSCPSPRAMNILSKSFEIDWQPYCDAFTVLGYFVKAAALLISSFIAFGVRK